MLDEPLRQRLEIFATAEGIDPAVVPFVRDVLEQFDAEDEVRTDARFGMLTSHLIAVLDRCMRGEALTAFSAEDIIDQAIAEHPHALSGARGLADQIADALDITLPETEVRILALHCAAL